MQQPKRIPVEPTLLDLPARYAVNIDRRDHHRFAGRGDAGKPALVDAGGIPAGDDLVAFGDLVFDGEIQVAKGRMQIRNKLRQPGPPWRLARDGVVVEIICADYLVRRGQIALIEDLLKKSRRISLF